MRGTVVGLAEAVGSAVAVGLVVAMGSVVASGLATAKDDPAHPPWAELGSQRQPTLRGARR
jgi:hypothetical protein